MVLISRLCISSKSTHYDFRRNEREPRYHTAQAITSCVEFVPSNQSTMSLIDVGDGIGLMWR